MNLLHRALLCVSMLSLTQCSLFFALLSDRPECESIQEAVCDGDVSVVCVDSQEIRIQCGEERGCNGETGECDLFCGDGVLQEERGELCDPGLDSDGQRDLNCNLVCQPIDGCGDGALSPPEECDDGNVSNGDGCDQGCRAELILEQESNDLPDLDNPITQDAVIRGNLISVSSTILLERDVYVLKNTQDEIIEVRVDVFDPRLGLQSCGARVGFPNLPLTMSAQNVDNVFLSLSARRSDSDDCPGFSLSLPPQESAQINLFITQPTLSGLLQSEYLLVIDFDGSRDCGDNVIQQGEQCELLSEELFCEGSPPQCQQLCDDECQLVPLCGNGVIEATVVSEQIISRETCDDGNRQPGDGCSASCQGEEFALEIEPNQDGAPDPSFDLLDPNDQPKEIIGNDFVSTGLPQTISSNTTISASLEPSGDEDIFVVQNTSSQPRLVRFETKGAPPQIPCNAAANVMLNLRDADGSFLKIARFKQFVPNVIDACVRAELVLQPQQKIFAQTLKYGDNRVTAAYLLEVEFSDCGDGHIESATEECDDGNGANLDGCNGACQREPSCGDGFVDLPESCDDQNALSGDGCGSTCQIEQPSVAEVEPNDITSNTLFTDNVVISGSLQGADKDKFAISNTSNEVRTLIAAVFDPVLGVDVSCGAGPSSIITLRDESGRTPVLTTFVTNPAIARCPSIQVAIAPQQTLLVELSSSIGPYLLSLHFVRCGDGIVELLEECDPADGVTCDQQCQHIANCGDGFVAPTEECDDGNTSNDDSCSALCTLRGFARLLEAEPNNTDPAQILHGNTLLYGSNRVKLPFSFEADLDLITIQNPANTTVIVRVDLYDASQGIEAPCRERPIRLNDALGNPVTARSLTDLCSGSGLSLGPNESKTFTISSPLATSSTAYILKVKMSDCGDQNLEVTEECEPPNSATCDAGCQRVPVCSDGFIDTPEQCDDNNAASGDGCSSGCAGEDGFVCSGQPSVCRPIVCGDGLIDLPEFCDDGNITDGDTCPSNCQLINTTETEPNEDGSPSLGGDSLLGNDFSTVNANGPFTSGGAILAAISPAGDEDVFSFTNPTSDLMKIRLDTFDAALGVGVSCGPFDLGGLDTVLNVFDSAQSFIVQSDERFGGADSCSGLSLFLSPLQTIFVQVLLFGDDATAPAYFLVAEFTPIVCGDGLVVDGEVCDDANTISNDGCRADCQQVEPGFVCFPGFCRAIVCGDGFADSPESCDDGNLLSEDGCSSACTVENAGFDCPAAQTLLTFAASDLPQDIPDANPNGITSTINVASAQTIKRVMLSIDSLTHTFDSDLDLSLISPTGNAVALAFGVGGVNDNFVATIFDDNCASIGGPISAATAPFTGCFSPQQPLAVLQEQLVTGDWELFVRDNFNPDIGTLHAWTLGFCVE